MNTACCFFPAILQSIPEPLMVRSATGLKVASCMVGFQATEGLHPALEGQKAESEISARRRLQPPGRDWTWG